LVVKHTMTEENEKVGSVSQSRYEQIVAELRDVVEQQTRGQFTIGDRALEIEPMRQRGGLVTETEWTVEQSLARLADDIGLSVATAKTTRWVASRWPKGHRQPKIASYTVHRSLANIEDDDERFAAIVVLSEGKSRWTADDAIRRVGQQVETPVTPQEKVTAIHSLAQDEKVAAAVTTDFLKRPQVAAVGAQVVDVGVGAVLEVDRCGADLRHPPGQPGPVLVGHRPGPHVAQGNAGLSRQQPHADLVAAGFEGEDGAGQVVLDAGRAHEVVLGPVVCIRSAERDCALQSTRAGAMRVPPARAERSRFERGGAGNRRQRGWGSPRP
jgi:hypothetical protein